MLNDLSAVGFEATPNTCLASFPWIGTRLRVWLKLYNLKWNLLLSSRELDRTHLFKDTGRHFTLSKWQFQFCLPCWDVRLFVPLLYQKTEWLVRTEQPSWERHNIFHQSGVDSQVYLDRLLWPGWLRTYINKCFCLISPPTLSNVENKTLM